MTEPKDDVISAAITIDHLIQACTEARFHFGKDVADDMIADAEDALEFLCDRIDDLSAKIEGTAKERAVSKMTTHFTATSNSQIIAHNLDSVDIIVSQPEFVGKFVLDENNVLLGPLTIGKHYEVWIYA